MSNGPCLGLKRELEGSHFSPPRTAVPPHVKTEPKINEAGIKFYYKTGLNKQLRISSKDMQFIPL